MAGAFSLGIGMIAGWLSNLQHPANQYWAVHPWQIFCLSYLYIIPAALTFAAWPLIGIMVIWPGFLVAYLSAAQGLRSAWLRSPQNAGLCLALTFGGLMVSQIWRGTGRADNLLSPGAGLTGALLVVLTWVVSAYVAQRTAVRWQKSMTDQGQALGRASYFRNVWSNTDVGK